MIRLPKKVIFETFLLDDNQKDKKVEIKTMKVSTKNIKNLLFSGDADINLLSTLDLIINNNLYFFN